MENLKKFISISEKSGINGDVILTQMLSIMSASINDLVSLETYNVDIFKTNATLHCLSSVSSGGGKSGAVSWLFEAIRNEIHGLEEQLSKKRRDLKLSLSAVEKSKEANPAMEERIQDELDLLPRTVKVIATQATSEALGSTAVDSGITALYCTDEAAEVEYLLAPTGVVAASRLIPFIRGWDNSYAEVLRVNGAAYSGVMKIAFAIMGQPEAVDFIVNASGDKGMVERFVFLDERTCKECKKTRLSDHERVYRDDFREVIGSAAAMMYRSSIRARLSAKDERPSKILVKACPKLEALMEKVGETSRSREQFYKLTGNKFMNRVFGKVPQNTAKLALNISILESILQKYSETGEILSELKLSEIIKSASVSVDAYKEAMRIMTLSINSFDIRSGYDGEEEINVVSEKYRDMRAHLESAGNVDKNGNLRLFVSLLINRLSTTPSFKGRKKDGDISGKVVDHIDRLIEAGGDERWLNSKKKCVTFPVNQKALLATSEEIDGIKNKFASLRELAAASGDNTIRVSNLTDSVQNDHLFNGQSPSLVANKVAKVIDEIAGSDAPVNWLDDKRTAIQFN